MIGQKRNRFNPVLLLTCMPRDSRAAIRMHGKNHPPLAAFRTGSTKPAFARVTGHRDANSSHAAVQPSVSQHAPPEDPAADPALDRRDRNVARGRNGWTRGWTGTGLRSRRPTCKGKRLLLVKSRSFRLRAPPYARWTWRSPWMPTVTKPSLQKVRPSLDGFAACPNGPIEWHNGRNRTAQSNNRTNRPTEQPNRTT